jgi:hypothetical protein
MSDFIRTSRASIYLPAERLQELCERLMDAGLRDAAEDLGAHDGFAESRKVDVLRVVEAWRKEVAPPDFGPDLEELWHALQQDVSGELSAA